MNEEFGSREVDAGPCPRARSRVASLLAAAVLALLPAAASAAYPEKQITFIVAYAPGGGSDIVARLLMPYVERQLGEGTRIVVQNRTGAGGAIGFAEIATAAPDGYTIGMINTPNVLTIPIERKSTFTWQSFDLIGNVVDDPGNFSVHRDTPIASITPSPSVDSARTLPSPSETRQFAEPI
jgi:tripartite-type tricarboxylate transporter receptor subunit TctC